MAFYQPQKAKGFNFSDDNSISGVLDKYKPGSHIIKTGRLCRELYKAQDSAYHIYLAEDNDGRRFVVSGQFPVLPSLDGYYEFIGTIKTGSKNEKQISVENYHAITPTTEDGVLTLLTTLPGLDTMAPRIYDEFGTNSIGTIKEFPELVVERVKGVTIKKVKQWQEYLLQNEESEAGMQALLGLGITQKQAATLLEKYGLLIVDRIKANPYLLAQEFPNFSFTKCDMIALKNGGRINDVNRLVQAMVYMMRREAFSSGNCCLPMDVFLDKALKVVNMTLDAKMAQKMIKNTSDDFIYVTIGVNKAALDRNSVVTALSSWNHREPFYYPIFDISREEVQEALSLCSGMLVVDEDDNVFLRHYYDAEKTVARTLLNIMACHGPKYSGVQNVIDDILAKENITLEAKQLEAVQTICEGQGGVYILTGSAGCGKTFTLNIILKVLRRLCTNQLDFSAKILAPTGKAAKVAAKATGLDASTIHMAIGYTPEEQHTKTVLGDVIIIDEFSMVDISLAAELFSSISPMSKVIILGDTKQLPSIGPGQVLADLISSNVIPTVELNVVKRQGSGSGILENANRIIAGEDIRTETKGHTSMDGDAYVEISAATAEDIINYIDRLLEFYSVDDIQVLCPQHKGPVGTDVLNYKIQQVLNPGQDGPLNKEIGDLRLCWRVGDKVIHIKNNYKIQWYIECNGQLLEDYDHIGIINGETGRIVSITDTKDKKEVVVQYDDGFVRYQDDFSELEHAYAMTIHKSQGSQWPVVICPLSDSSILMMNRKLLYTMYTRAQKVNVVIGSKKAISEGLKEGTKDRLGSLCKRLSECR